jgi:hypothetical protein
MKDSHRNMDWKNISASTREEEGWTWKVQDTVGVQNEEGDTPTEEYLRQAAEYNDFTRFNEKTLSLEVLVNNI